MLLDLSFNCFYPHPSILFFFHRPITLSLLFHSEGKNALFHVVCHFSIHQYTSFHQPNRMFLLHVSCHFHTDLHISDHQPIIFYHSRAFCYAANPPNISYFRTIHIHLYSKKIYLFHEFSCSRIILYSSFHLKTLAFLFLFLYHSDTLPRISTHLTIPQLQIHAAYRLSILQCIQPHQNVCMSLFHSLYRWPITLHRYRHLNDKVFLDHLLGFISSLQHIHFHLPIFVFLSLLSFPETILLHR